MIHGNMIEMCIRDRYLDGATRFQTLLHCIIPLSKPAIATQAVLAFNGYWDEFVGFMRSLFNATFKTNPYLERAVMTLSLIHILEPIIVL